MSKKVNTSKSVKEKPKTTLAELDKQVKDVAKVLGSQKKVKVTIPKILEGRLGSVVPVGVNGAIIQVPVGVEVEIPEAMAKVLTESINQISY